MRISRRQFTVLLLGTAALAGCQQAGPAPAPKTESKPVDAKPAAPAAAPATAVPAAKTDSKPAAASAAKPQQKDNLIVAYAGEPNSLDTTNELGNVGVRMHYVFH